MASELAKLGVREADGLAADLVAVLDALIAAGQATATDVDRNEALALGALLGLRLASAGVAVAAVLEVVSLLERARREIVAGPSVSSLLAVVLEGYVGGVREATVAAIEARIVREVEMVALAPGLVLVPLPHLEDTDRMGSAVDALGRKLLSRDVKACALWVQGPIAHREEASLAGIAGFVENARMVGAKVAIAAPEEALRKRVAERLDGSVPVEAELGAALEALGYTVKEGSVLRRWLGR